MCVRVCVCVRVRVCVCLCVSVCVWGGRVRVCITNAGHNFQNFCLLPVSQTYCYASTSYTRKESNEYDLILIKTHIYMDAQHGRQQNGWRISLTATTQECCGQYWTRHGGSTQQNSSCTTTNHPSRKLSKFDEPDIWDTAGKVGTSSSVMYSSGSFHVDEQRQDDQLEPTCSSSVPILDVVLKMCRKQWTLGRCGERGSGRSVLAAWQDDVDDDDELYYSGLMRDIWIMKWVRSSFTIVFSHRREIYQNIDIYHVINEENQFFLLL